MDIWLKWIYQCTIAQQILVNKVKLCTLKVQHDVQLAIFCWSIKDCPSQASYDSTIKGLGPKILAYRVFSSGGTGGSLSRLCLPLSRHYPTRQKFPENNRKTIASPSQLCPLHQGLLSHKNVRKTIGKTTAYCSKTIAYC